MKHLANLCALILMLVALRPLLAAEEINGQFDWVESYRHYERNPFAIEMPFDDDNFTSLQNHLNRYTYLLLYWPTDDLSTLRIGFFPSKKQADAFHRATQKRYHHQHVVQVSREEHAHITKQLNDSSAGILASSSDKAPLLLPIDPDNKKAFQQYHKNVLDSAKIRYMAKDYATAARLYLLLTSVADHDMAAWASELAGLCFEKMKHRDLAIKQYQQVLEQFPESRGVPRVTQRLRGLETAAADDSAALKTASQTDSNDFFTRGVFGQYFRSVSRSVGEGGSEEVLSLLSTDWDVRSTLHSRQHDFHARINGYQLNDNLDSGDNELRLQRLFVDYRHRESGFESSLGRQKDSGTGVFTSFDGASVSYPVKENLYVGMSAGIPVYNSDVYEGLDYRFFSAHSHWDIDQHWLLGAYLMKQTLNSVTDREALGLQGRYNDKRLSGSINMDYDIAFSELNNMLLNVLYRFTDNTNITALFGHQRSPLLSATNILIGQADLDLESYLRIKENKDNLLDDAFARTSLNEFYSFSFNTRLREDIRWIIDLYDSNLTDVPSSELLLGLPDTGASPDEFSYQSLGTQLVVQNLFAQYDSTTFGFRHTKSDTSDGNQLYVFERLRLSTTWTLVPKFLYSKINTHINDATQTQIRYSINANYRPWRQVEFNLEAGNEMLNPSGGDIDFESHYIFAGYRMNF